MYQIVIGLLVAGTSLYLNTADAAEKEVIYPTLKQTHLQVNSDQFMRLGVRTDFQGTRHARYQQHYEDIPIWGAFISKHRSLHGEERTQGVIYHHLKEDLGERPASLKDLSSMLHVLKQRYPQASILHKAVQPLIYIDEDNQAHWANLVFMMMKAHDKRPQKLALIVDAVSFKEYESWDTIKTFTKVNGLGFGGNGRVGKIQYDSERKILPLVRDEHRGECLMQNAFVTVQDMHSKYSGVSPISSFHCEQKSESYWTGVNQDGYDEVNESYSPTNDALYIGTRIHEMFSEWYHLDALGGSEDSPKTLIMRVHYGQGYENAFWDGRQMSFGDGGKSMYSLVVASVSAHEIAHGFTEHHSNLVYTGQSGAMNESFSDMAAQAFEYYLYGKNSWMIASDAMKGSVKALRYMKDPALDGRSINHAKDYYKGLDVHYASGVYNRFFYVLTHVNGWNTKKAFDIMLKANVDYWVPTSNYEDGACGVLWAAEDLAYPVSDVQAAFKTVGIEVKQCGV